MPENGSAQQREALKEFIASKVEPRHREFESKTYRWMRILDFCDLILFIALLLTVLNGVFLKVGSPAWQDVLKWAAVLLPIFCTAAYGVARFVFDQFEYRAEYREEFEDLLSGVRLKLAAAKTDEDCGKIHKHALEKYSEIEKRRQKRHLAMYRRHLDSVKVPKPR